MLKNIAGAVALAAFALGASADQGGFFNTGGSLANAPVSSPSGTLSIVGSALTFTSSDATTIINATFSSDSTVENCSGGGKGGHITCSYTFTGLFSGALTVNDQVEAINGSTIQIYGTDGVIITGATGYNSAYTPFYFANSGQILRSDDLLGTNLITYGVYGSGVGQFYGSTGIALDAQGRIYVADTYNSRIVRIDDMKGTNWTTYGTYGPGVGQFQDPQYLSIDSTGRIYVMDTGNSRLVRMDDMTGKNWAAFNGVGSGVGQLSSYIAPAAFDSTGRIYIADSGNGRIVRMDDMNGTNWTSLSQSPVINGYIFSFGDPVGVALDSTDRIYVATAGTDPSVVRVDDMTGTNWTIFYTNKSANPNGIAIDRSGMVLVSGDGVQTIDNMAGSLMSGPNLTIGFGPAYTFGVTPIPHPNPLPAAITYSPTSLTFASQNIGTSSPPQDVTITNFGGSPLNLNAAASAGFVATTVCPASLQPGTCSIEVALLPTTAGPITGNLMLTDNSGNLGSTQTVALSGYGTAPGISVVPGSLAFQPQAVNTTSGAQSVALYNIGTGPLQLNTATAPAPFSATNNCNTNISPGGGCTISVSFKPASTGAATGALSINTNAGSQIVSLSGSGTSAAPTVLVTPAQLLFPPQLLNTKSPVQTVTITNTGKSSVTVSGASATAPFAETNTCKSSLAGGRNCVVSVTYTPSAVATQTGTLTVNLSTGAQTVSLAGSTSTKSLPGALKLSPSLLSFQNYTVGDNPTKAVTVTNTSAASVGIEAIAFTGSSTITESSKCPGILLAGSACTINVAFRPKTYGTFTSTLTLTEASGDQDIVPIKATSVSGGN